ncbi:type III-A CRISPR-associated RAMP protein Csm3 [Chlorobium phaeobacteroides]|uniref:CRISPR system Cms endoribonuclease Csm3 n=1 Tax=Chlorobium phaeobacteroides (strain DSM 266 / SMG 266 / 2430) TaxID=290317 RepID=A1BI33_CHLPD|nr:type III-A CRISPR-associated RAMP protein Csm3 [Chlorobium phaeobacteroides]ABL66060.1 CRISPR-associated protein, Csm3 family [Chlorobium phaeobacteroides DSM 266]
MADIERQIKLLGYIKITGIIEALTGLHIGGTADSIDKGGIDNPVIKNPVTNEPYIPGSSFRGRMRSLLEKKTAEYLSPMTGNKEIWMEIYKAEDEKYNNNKAQSTIDAMNSEVCRVFGNSASYESVPSVLIVRDALYTEKTRESYMQGGKGGLPITEAKMEIAVDRITAHALPRTIERVPAGAKFAFEIVYKIQSTSFICVIDEKGKPKEVKSYMADDKVIEKDIENILWALKQIEEHDGLGGNTSRGHGQVKFSIDPIKYEVFEDVSKQKIEKAIKNIKTTKEA